MNIKMGSAMSSEFLNDELTECQKQAVNYGNGKGDDYISSRCLDNWRLWANPKTVTESPKNKLKIYGFKNMIIMDDAVKNKTHIIAGKSTQLNSIKAIAIDDTNNEIATLEEDGKIFFYSSIAAGNVAPNRTLVNKALPGSTELFVDSENNHVIAFNPVAKKIFYFSREANIYAHGKIKKLEILKSINLYDFDLTNFKFIPYITGQ